MNWLGIAGIAPLFALAALTGAQEADKPKPLATVAAPREGTENLSAWQWYQDVPHPTAVPRNELADFLLTPNVFERARPDLADLRLYDSRGREVPYALRVRYARDERQQLAARQFNRVTHKDGSAEVTLDLGESPGEHNEIRVQTSGTEFVRRLRVQGSDDQQDWSTVFDRFVARFKSEGKMVETDTATYPANRHRYLRVRVAPFESLPEDKPGIDKVEVLHTVRVAKEEVTRDAVLESRQPVPADGGPGSAWFITFGNGEMAPVEKLHFDIRDAEFTRPYRLETANSPDEPPTVLDQGQWHRAAHERHRPMTITIPETTARRLRLVVTDARNPPLDLTGAQYTAAARQVVFAPPDDAMGPLHLYFGNPRAGAPHYDFASSLPPTPDPPPARVELGTWERNPVYVEPPKPWTERWPWLVYAVLGAACATLLGLLGLLSRETIARHDAGTRGEVAKVASQS